MQTNRRTTAQRATATALLAGGLALTGAVTGAVAQAPPLIPITQLDAAARAYVSYNGSSISQLGESNPDRLIGRAMPCRAGDDASYTVAPGTAYPMPGGTRYVADATSRQEPLSILAEGVVNGRLGAGPVTAEARADKLTRLDITEAVRLSINTSDDSGSLSQGHLRFLSALTGTLPEGYAHWCVITSASVWNVRYETYDRRRVRFGLPEGLWIATANGDYSRNALAVVPYQVVTFATTAYAASWVQEQSGVVPTPSVPVSPSPSISSLLGGLLQSNGSPPAPPPPPSPPGPVPVRAMVGALTPEALAAGDRIGDVLSEQVALEGLLDNREVRARLLADPAVRNDLRASPEP